MQERCEYCPIRLECLSSDEECRIINVHRDVSPSGEHTSRVVKLEPDSMSISLETSLKDNSCIVHIYLAVTRKAFEAIASLFDQHCIMRGAPFDLMSTPSHVVVHVNEDP